MGVQAIRTITGKKEDTVLTTPATALAAFPAAGEVSVVTILAVADQHRLADAERAIRICLDYARDNNLYTSAVSVSVVTTLNGGKA